MEVSLTALDTLIGLVLLGVLFLIWAITSIFLLKKHKPLPWLFALVLITAWIVLFKSFTIVDVGQIAVDGDQVYPPGFVIHRPFKDISIYSGCHATTSDWLVIYNCPTGEVFTLTK